MKRISGEVQGICDGQLTINMEKTLFPTPEKNFG